jgi:hypothetical protein
MERFAGYIDLRAECRLYIPCRSRRVRSLGVGELSVLLMRVERADGSASVPITIAGIRNLSILRKTRFETSGSIGCASVPMRSAAVAAAAVGDGVFSS